MFADDFDGSTLDRSKWQVIVTGQTVNDEQQAYVDSPATLEVADGVLAIRPRFAPDHRTTADCTCDFISARIEGRDRFEFTYGRVEARIKLSVGLGVWPAFWVLGPGPWPDTGEIDILENVGDPTWTSVSLHGPGYSGNTPIAHRHVFPHGQDVTGWHVYSADWRTDRIVFAVDGIETYRVTRPMVEQYGRWAYEAPKFLILNVAIGGNYPRMVNRAVEPYPGLPEATVHLIQSNDAVMLVDWVKVTD